MGIGLLLTHGDTSSLSWGLVHGKTILRISARGVAIRMGFPPLIGTVSLSHSCTWVSHRFMGHSHCGLTIHHMATLLDDREPKLHIMVWHYMAWHLPYGALSSMGNDGLRRDTLGLGITQHDNSWRLDTTMAGDNKRQ